MSIQARGIPCRRLQQCCFVICLLLPPLAAGNVHAAIFNAVDDFSNTTNSETSTWSYRFSGLPVRDGTYDLLVGPSDEFGWSPSTPYWNIGPGVPSPGVGVNRSGGLITGNGVVWQDDTIWMHPSGLAVVSWLSPFSGPININFSFADIDPRLGEDGVSWFVDRNSLTGQLASGTLAEGGSSGVLSLNNILVSEGDRINFVVDRNTSSSFDSTQFTATIDTVPEPTSLLLWGLGGIGIALGRKRLRRAAND